MSLYLKQIEQLVALQHIDAQIHTIRKDLISAPKEIDKLKINFNKVTEEKVIVEDKLTHLKEQEKKLKLEIEEDIERIRKSNNKLMMISNSKEYQAMKREMDSLEKINNDREEKQKLMQEELELQNSSCKSIKEQYTQLQTELTEKETNLSLRTEKSQKDLNELDQQRKAAGKEVPIPVLGRYEFIRERLNYPVIVPVNEGTCSGCHISIPPQSYIELQKGKQILSCPNCQRLVYWGKHFTEEV